LAVKLFSKFRFGPQGRGKILCIGVHRYWIESTPPTIRAPALAAPDNGMLIN
jgi:hypothetical protein